MDGLPPIDELVEVSLTGPQANLVVSETLLAAETSLQSSLAVFNCLLQSLCSYFNRILAVFNRF